MIKHKLEKNPVISKLVPDFMDTLYINVKLSEINYVLK